MLFCSLLLSACENDAVEPNGGKDEGLPTLITHPNTDLTIYSTKITGAITDEGDSEIIEAGFVVDTVPTPTVQKNLNKFIREPDRDGLMTAIINDIPAYNTYYVRSYATNGQGTGYGNEIKFSSLTPNIFKGDVILSTQQEVEAFAQPKYTTIDGSLVITGSVTDLSPLQKLVIVNYALYITNTTHLTTIKGLSNLEAVNASYFYHGMRIENNKALRSLEGLEKLIGNNGYFSIINNDEITDLNGLNNLLYNHGGALRIEGCDQLRSLHGLEKFNWLDGDIMMKDNPVLEDITALRSLNLLKGSISIMNNTSLQNVNGFESLHRVEVIGLYDNMMLSDLKGFSNLDTITMGISLRNNNALKDLSGLEKIKTCDYLSIDDSPALTSLKGMENLQQVGHAIYISNAGLTNVDALGNVNRAQRIILIENDNLENILGLNKLTTLAENGSSLTIVSNNRLKSLAGLNNLAKADGEIFIERNEMLTDFCSLKPLLKTGWNNGLSIGSNAANPNAAEIINSCP